MIRFALSAWLWIALATLIGGCSDGSDGPRTVDVPPEVEQQDLCDLPVDDIPVFSTESGIEYVRTPDACFDNLEGYPFQPHYVEVEGLRYHYVDEGPADGEVVLMLHGQPSWSYLYRKMIPVLVEAGYRVIAADHIGMGRSDKPVDPRVHEFENHVRWMKLLIGELGLFDITLFVQDWGSHVGLRVAGDQPDLFARIVVANGDLIVIPPGLNPFTPPVFEFDETVPPTLEFFTSRSREPISAFQEWIEFAAQASHLFAADVVELGTVNELTETEFAAYNAPYPSQLYWGGIRAFPSMVAGITDQNAPAFEELGRFDRPFLFLAGENDPSAGSVENHNKWIAHVPGATGQDHRRYSAGHFIQEDVGAEMAADVVAFMQNPAPITGPLFNLRYCEILLQTSTGENLEARVYNTLGLNDCPEAAWEAIDLDAAAADNDAQAAIRNGPRYWVLDLITPIVDDETPPIPGFGDTVTFGELDMSLRATISLELGTSAESEAYTVIEVVRSTVFTYVAGRRIYELEDPQGARYIMQSMSQMNDPSLQLHNLHSLDERLELPEGWSFSTRVLTEPLQLTANGIARVVTDDLSNTFQLVD
jgi:pimeloyl-ACP methyl ester carboxylesterase